MEMGAVMVMVLVVMATVFTVFFFCAAVVNAATRFYTSTAVVSSYDEEGVLQQHMTPPLHAVFNPEEKRRIIGDTFIKVANEAMEDLDLQADQIFLAQGMHQPPHPPPFLMMLFLS